MANFDYDKLRGKRLNFVPTKVQIGEWSGDLNEVIICGEVGPVSLATLAEVARHYLRLTNQSLRPPLASLVCAATGDLRALEFFFPISTVLDEEERPAFFRFLASIIQHPNFRLRVIGSETTDVTTQIYTDIPGIVAGHLAEIFFYRPDLLDRFLSSPRNFWLYTNQQAFEAGGGLAGGDYNPEREAIELVISRLYEGYGGLTPGVAPFLHELGHMLDHYDCATLRLAQSKGFLPGMNPEDGSLFSPHARSLFIKGKQIEQARYIAYQTAQAKEGDAWPIGHPYVFQNDTEFIAGYFEMFFRNPNYFADQNPTLYASFIELFGQDPRRYWPSDFPFYRDENRKVYVERHKIGVQNITVPEK
ncbi:MAG: hypothetical protein WCS37_05970 [Chloroflexota bacterium]|nr:hypothetical protein [Chloroflexota bacterium]